MLQLINWMCEHIRQGHCLECGCEIWSIFDCKRCYNCGLKYNVTNTS